MAQGVNVGVGYVEIRPDMTGFSREVQVGINRDLAVAGEAGGKSLAGGIGTSLKSAVGIAAGLVGARAITDFFQDSVQAASDLEEAINVTGLVFKDARGEIDRFVESSTQIGLSEAQARELTASLGGLLQNLGLTTQQTVEWSQRLTTLGADMGSAFNAEPVDAIQAIGAALRGETEPIRRFNVVLSDAVVKQKAVEMGLASTTAEVSQQAKTMATLQLIMDGTKDIQGDFANTSDSLANQQRRLAAETENVKAKLGAGLTPALANITGFINDKVVPAFLWLMETVGEGMTDAAGFFVGAVADMISVTAKALEKVDQFIPGMEGVPEAMQDAVKGMRATEAGLHDMESAFGDTTTATEGQTGAMGDLALGFGGAGAAAQGLVGDLEDLLDVTLETTGAQRSLDQASRQLDDARRGQADAQEALNRLLRQGAVDLDKVADAEERLHDAKRATGKATREQAKAQAEYDKALAVATDLRGLDSAQEALAEATEKLADANENLADAQDDEKDAAEELRRQQAGDPDFNDKLADAKRRVRDATVGVADAEYTLAQRAYESLEAQNASKDAFAGNADQALRLREEIEKLIVLYPQLAPFLTPQLAGLPQQQTVSPDFIGPLTQLQKVQVSPDFIGPLSGRQTYGPVTINQTFTGTQDPAAIAREIAWQVN